MVKRKVRLYNPTTKNGIIHLETGCLLKTGAIRRGEIKGEGEKNLDLYGIWRSYGN